MADIEKKFDWEDLLPLLEKLAELLAALLAKK